MDVQTISTLASGLVAVAATLGCIRLMRYFGFSETQESLRPSDALINPYAPSVVPEATADSHAENPLAQPYGLSGRTFLFPVAAVVFGTLLGVVSRWLRPFANVGGTHFEALAALAALLLGCLLFVYLNGGTRGTIAHLLYQLENLAMWSGFLCGWSAVHGAFWEDMIAMSLGWWVGCAAFGSLLLSVVQRIRGRKTTI